MVGCSYVPYPFYHSSFTLVLQEAVRKAQEELTKQKEVIMAQDKELKVNLAYYMLDNNMVYTIEIMSGRLFLCDHLLS